MMSHERRSQVSTPMVLAINNLKTDKRLLFTEEKEQNDDYLS